MPPRCPTATTTNTATIPNATRYPTERARLLNAAETGEGYVASLHKKAEQEAA
jgi:hypothetical protein